MRRDFYVFFLFCLSSLKDLCIHTGVVLRGANTREDEVHSLGSLNIVEYVRFYNKINYKIVDLVLTRAWYLFAEFWKMHRMETYRSICGVRESGSRSGMVSGGFAHEKNSNVILVFWT